MPSLLVLEELDFGLQWVVLRPDLKLLVSPNYFRLDHTQLPLKEELMQH